MRASVLGYFGHMWELYTLWVLMPFVLLPLYASFQAMDHSVVQAAQSSTRLAEVVAAQWCADNALSNLRLTRQLPGVGDADFSCEQLGRPYAGTLATRPTPNPNFRRVDAQVSDEEGRGILTLSTILPRQVFAE